MSEPVRESFIDRQMRSSASIKAGLCACLQCIKDRGEVRVRMSLCPTCGNKRCPKASNHRLECSGSNDVGQPGSFYGPRPATPENG